MNPSAANLGRETGNRGNRKADISTSGILHREDSNRENAERWLQ